MTDAPLILNVQKTDECSPLIRDNQPSPILRPPPFIKDLSREDQNNSSRFGLLRRDTYEDKSSNSRRSSVDTLKSASRKRMSLNVTSASPTLNSRRLSRFKDATEQASRSPFPFKRQSTNKPGSMMMRPSPTLGGKPKDKRHPLKARSTKDFGDQSMGDSKSFSELEDLQNLYHKQMQQKSQMELPGSQILHDLSPNTNTHTEKKLMKSRVAEMYYQMLRKKFTRNMTMPIRDTAEFLDQVHLIKDNITTPNVERIRDLVLIEKDPLEKLRVYHDRYPLLGLRKGILRVTKTISIVCKKIITHPIFEYFILIVIIVNSVLLAMDDPTTSGIGSAEADTTLLVIYTMECVLKIIGMGFLFNKNAYLLDLWNIMDFIIVVTGYIPILLASDGLNLQAFRALRVLRPLRTISNIKALKMLIKTLMSALKPLLETLFILFFVFLIFAIAGLQLFSGLLKKRCFQVDTGIPMVDLEQDDDHFEKLCNNDDDCPNIDGAYVCGKMIKNPNFDITNFDTLQNSFLMVFQIVTLEGWSDIMFYLERTFTPIVAIYFVVLIIICSFFLLNLTLAVLKTKFDETNQSEEKAKDLNTKYWLHGENYFNSLEVNKRDVLKLMRKRQNGEITFNKYEMHKDTLKAVTKGKIGVSRNKRRINTTSRFAWLRESMIYNSFAKNPAKRWLGAIATAAKRIAVTRANSSQETNRSGMSKVDTIKMDEKSTATQATPQILITAKTKSLRKVASELMALQQTQAVSPTENVPTEKAEQSNSATKPLLSQSPLSGSPQEGLMSPIRPLESDRLLASPSKENRGGNKAEHIGETPSLVVIPSVVEPLDTTPQHSLAVVNSKNFLSIQRNNFFSNSLKPSAPIRPLLAEKVRITTAENEKKDGVDLINIAGIRNKTVEKSKAKPKLLAKNTFMLDASPLPDYKEISFNGGEEQSVFDLLDAKSPIERKVKSRESVSRFALMKQINQIKKVKKPDDLKKSRISQSRLSQALTSMFDLDEEHPDKAMDGIAPTGILDDSDFFDEKERIEMIRRKRHQRHHTKKLSGARSPNKRRTNNMLTSFGHLPESRALLKGNSSTQIGAKKYVRPSVEVEKPATNLRMVEDEPDERHIIDIRYLKAVPAFERDYNGDCVDDVLPLKKENEQKEREAREKQMLLKARLPLQYKITGLDEKRARDRLDSYYSKSASHASIVGTRKSRRLRDDESMMGPQTSRSVVEREFETGNSKQGLNRGAKKSFSKKRTYNPNNTHAGTVKSAHSGPSNQANDEDFFKMENIKDYMEVYKWMERALPNEGIIDNPDLQIDKINKEFNLIDEYKGIRRKDLKENKIAEANWSGDNVLPQTTVQVPVDKVKKALNIQDYDIWRTGYWGVWHGFRRTCKAFTESSFFNAVIMLSVFFNTIILATEGLITDSPTQDLLNTFNFVFTIIFTIEMGLKLIGLGIIGYIGDKMNIFDAAVVIISLVEEIFLTGGGNKAVSAFRTIRLFRTFRVLRVTKLLRSLKYMQVIIVVIGRSMNKFAYILILLFLFVFIYTLLGMQLFGGGLNLDDNTGQDRTRQNFDTFWNAFMTSFQIMSIENWQQILFLAIRSTTVNTMISILYLVSWIWIGNYIFLNLFLAILLDEFTVEDVAEEFDDLREDDGGTTYSNTSRTHTLDRSEKMGTQKTLSKDSTHPKTAPSKGLDNDFDDDEEGTRQVKNDQMTIRICEKSLYIFSKQNLLRRFCLKVIQHRFFERMILTMIVLSSLKLAFDTYFDDDANSVIDVSNQIDDGLNVFFAIEAAMKIISLGLVVDRGCYLRDSWNKLDLLIVIASILDMSFENINLSFIRILRLLRTLRPLRFITHNKSMKLIVTALIESVGAILNVIIVVLLIWLMFAILAVNIVGSKLGYCGGLPDNQLYYNISITQCPVAGGTWTTPHVNFDNVFQGLVSLFILSTQEGWPDIMYSVVDANDASEGPILNNQIVFAYIYFVVFIFVGSYFLVNLFIGVIFLEFAKAEKREKRLKEFLTPQQQNWITMQRLLLTVKPDVSGVEPKNRIMKKVFRFINHTKFEIFIMSIIVLNILLMAITYEGSSDNYNEVLKYINWCFSGIFMIELILKHIGLGFKRYWAGGWNRFDAFVVLASALDITMDVAQQSFFSFIRIGPQLARVFRVLRVSRLFKLVKQFEGLQKMLNTLVFTLPSLFNVGALLFLVYFIYSILATFLFNSVRLGERVDDTRYRHFQNFGMAIITLFRCSTGEDWWIFMFDTLSPQLCTDGTNTCGTWAAYPFWISFIVVCQFIFLNLFILVILQQFEEYHLNDDNPINTFTVMMDNHIKPAWEELAKRHGGTHIHESQLVEFFCRFNYPYGYKNSHHTKAAVTREIMHMEIPEDERNMIYYNDIIFTLLRNGFYHVQDDLENEGQLEIYDNQRDYINGFERYTRKKLDNLKKTIRVPSLRRKSTFKQATKTKKYASANPIPRILFMGMTMRAWLTYAHRVTEKMKAAKENGYEYIESESDQDDYTFNSDNSDSEEEQESGNKMSGYIKEEEEADDSDDMEKERINTEQQSLIDIEPSDRKHQDEEKDYIFNGDISPAGRDEEMGNSYNAARLNLRNKNNNQRNQNGTKITITSHSSIKGGSHYELERNKSASRLTPQRLIKFVENADLSEFPAKASYSFLDPEVSPKKFESKKTSKSNLEDEKHSVINFNINNNVVINNNFYIQANPNQIQNAPSENAEIAAASPISRETSITIERNISVNRSTARRGENNPRVLVANSRDIEEGGASNQQDLKDTPTSKKSK